eukprot:7557975-Prorocentrum_lima.AAC.1
MFYHELQTTETEKCPLDEVSVSDTTRENAVKGKQKYLIEPSCLAADPEKPSGALQWVSQVKYWRVTLRKAQ